MGFFSDLMGRSASRDAQRLGQRNMKRINDGYESADNFAGQGYQASTGRLQPFMDTSRRGYDLYADSYGVNGNDARQRAFGTFASDPFNAHSGEVTGNALRGIMRTAASRGMGNSGATQLAMSRAGLEAQDRRVADWRQGLGGMGNQAVGLAGTMAGLDQNYYGGMADRAVGRANALNGTDANATMAANNARSAGVNNLLGIFGNVAGLGMQAMGMPAMRRPAAPAGGYNNDPGGTYWVR